MKNPVRSQKCLYKYLNKKRIEGLLGARGSDKKKMWMVGQYVTLEQEHNTGSLVDKLASPRNANIYKIISINKEGFSCSVINVLSGAVYEVLQSRLRQLSLVDLESAHFGHPDLYKNLAKLTHKLRHKFQPGSQSPMGLKLLSDWPNEKSESLDTWQDSGSETLNIVGGVNEAEEDGLVGGEESKEEDDWKEKGVDIKPGHRDRTPEMDRISEDSDGTRMNTRYKGRKHVNVYDLKLAMNCGKSILKGHVEYTKFMNSNLNLFRTLNKSSFHAHKNALKNHKDI